MVDGAPSGIQHEIDRLAERVGDAVQAAGLRVACAESLTSGAIATALGKAPDASEWFCGAVVAYTSDTKFRVLGVEPGPVITAKTAREMAAGVAELLAADVVVAVTGAGGPGPEEGKAAGTVFIAGGSGESIRVDERRFDGEPAEVVAETVRAALEALLDGVHRRTGAQTGEADPAP